MKNIATKSTTEYILEKYNLSALKKYGQNFITDTNTIERICKSANLSKEKAVIEVGPGIGALTELLGKYAGKVISYEIDERFKDVYEEFFSNSNITIYFQDILKSDLRDVIDKLKQEYQEVIFVSNLPYYITTDILEYILQYPFDKIVVMVQKEVATKYCGDYKSPLTYMMDSVGKRNYEFTVSRHIFNPEPRVDSAVFSISIHDQYDESLWKLLNVCFVQRRKTILNNLKNEYRNAKEILEACNISEKTRSEQLTLDDYLKMNQYIKENEHED